MKKVVLAIAVIAAVVAGVAPNVVASNKGKAQSCCTTNAACCPTGACCN